MGFRTAKVIEDVGAVTPSFFEGVREDS